MKTKIKQYLKKRPLLMKYARLVTDSSLTGYNYKKKIKGKKNKIKISRTAILNKCEFNIIGNNNFIEIGESNILRNVTFYIKGDNNIIKFGDSVFFNRAGSVWVEDIDCKILVNDKTTFEDVHLAATEPKSQIIIGKDCMFAYDIDVRTGDSHSIINTTTGKRINFAKDVIIGNHIWVASHVSILKGVTISDNSIIATRSVVTKPMNEPNTLIAGSPAKQIKENIDWDRRRIYN